jgi:SAM-dependent methyltransferase
MPLYRAREAALIGEAMGAQPVRRWLDAGCGDGRFAKLLDAAAPEIPVPVGVDADEHRLARASRVRAHCYLVRADLGRLPFADGSYDVVVCNSVLEHMDDPDAALREFARILAVGGRLLLTVPNCTFEDLLLGSRLLRALRMPALAARHSQHLSRYMRHFHYWEVDALASRACAHALILQSHVPYASRFLCSTGSLLYLARIAGLGGSRYSLLPETELRRRPIVRALRDIAIALEAWLIRGEAESGRTGPFGCAFIVFRRG